MLRAGLFFAGAVLLLLSSLIVVIGTQRGVVSRTTATSPALAGGPGATPLPSTVATASAAIDRDVATAIRVGATTTSVPISSATAIRAVTTPPSGTRTATAASVTPQALVDATARGGGTISPAGRTRYPLGSAATYRATAALGQVFVGWTLDGRYVGIAPTLTFPATGDRAVVARFTARPTFPDVPAADPDYTAITTLAALGIVGPGAGGNLEPDGPVDRAELATTIARIYGWQRESHPNPFPDRCDPTGTACLNDEQLNAIAALAAYDILDGYTDPAACAAFGTTAPCYNPRAIVARVQAVGVVARAFTKAPESRPTGTWDRLAADPAQDTNVPNAGTRRSDLATYRRNAGPIPGQVADGQFPGPDDGASRRFVIQILWQAYRMVYGADRLP